MPNFPMGKDAKIYQGTAGAALATLTEMSNVKNVDTATSAAEADVTTRANNGWKATAAGLRELTVDFEMLRLPSDAGFKAMRTAFLTGGLVELAVLSQAREVNGAEGPKGSFSITGFSMSEPLEEAQSVKVTAKLSVYGEWVEI